MGLAGSSAIVTATLKCLMDFFNLTESDMSKAFQPQFILDVEKSELHINAGLQDRVIQVKKIWPSFQEFAHVVDLIAGVRRLGLHEL